MANIDDDEIETEDETDEEETVKYHDYKIASYPSDYNLPMIKSLWDDGSLAIPDFQRNFVWTIKQSSLLIESFLLGLPVPQAFIFIDSDESNLVIDGQQRILSIVFFLEGYFGPETHQGKRSVFRLTGLDKKSPYNGKRYEDLTSTEKSRLKNAVLRVVNIKQLSPSKDSTSVYHIFERLNTGGTPLKPQEIRNCVFHGPIVEELNKLNELPEWREIIGRKYPDKHQRDVEFILRIFAFSYDWKSYEKPMKEFLNARMSKSRNDEDGKLSEFGRRFQKVCKYIVQELGPKPFHLRGPINLAAVDSVISILIRYPGSIPTDLPVRFKRLNSDKLYLESVSYNTSDASVVSVRLKKAEEYLLSK